MAAIDLGPKVLELGWLERLAGAIQDAYLQKLFASQIPETRSHVMMGRFMVERFVSQPVDVELCQELVAMARRDYTTALQGIADFVLTSAGNPPQSARN
jgi:hypothetical protein